MNNLFKKITIGIGAVLCLLSLSVPAMATRIKDMAAIQGVRSNQLTGYGLVVGLNGTGDKN
ncbi:MAG: flagellar basal body P-ring protein FlgI, partial [Desulfobacteraceae bacterium]|nr:flagellar basal body P-ring protein FlgI [Desulfobacteraceae bacterium]